MSRKKAVAGGIGALSILLTAGMTLAPAASATENHTAATEGNSAYALAASGLLKIAPIPAVNDEDGFAQKSVAEVELPGGLVKASVLNARAGAGEARSSIADLTVNLPQLSKRAPLLTATAIEAKCAGGEGSSSLAKATLGDKTLDIAAPANTVVGVPGLASVTLNKQTKNDDGSVTITAIEVNVDGIQKVQLASVTCAAGDDGGTPTTTAKPTPTTEPTSPSETPTDEPSPTTTNGNSGSGSGDKPDSDGNAPTPTPVKSHLDVTG